MFFIRKIVGSRSLKSFLIVNVLLFITAIPKGYAIAPRNVHGSVLLNSTVLYKIFKSEDKSFKLIEERINDEIKKSSYPKAIEESKKLGDEAIRVHSDYWVCVSYFYLGYVSKYQKDYQTSLRYLRQILDYKTNSFHQDPSRIVKVYSNIAAVCKKLNHTAEAINFYRKALDFKDKLIDKKSLIPTYINLGSLYSSGSKFNEAKECYLNALELGNKEPNSTTAIIYNNLGNDEFVRGNYSKAIEYYISSIEISEKINDWEGLALSYNNLGNIYTNELKNPDKAIEYFTKSLEIEKKKNNPEGIAWELVSIGNVYTSVNKFNEAEKSLTEALQLFKSLQNNKGIAKSLENIGALFTVRKDYKNAIAAFSECIKIDELSKTDVNLANVYNNLGISYKHQQEFDHAFASFFKALDMAKSANDKSMTYRIFSGLYETYAQLGQYDKAYQYLKDYSDLKDTLLNATISRQIIDIQEKYEKSKMEQKVALQNLEIKNKSLQRNGLLAFLALAIIIFSSLLYFIIQKRKNEKLLYLRNTQLKDREIENLVQQSEIKSMLSLAEGQENERQRISRELHDRVGSMLSLIKLNLSNYEQDDKLFVAENLLLLENTYQEVRNISHNLHSGLLTRFGLKAALRDLKNTVESHNTLRVNLSFHEEELVLSKDMEVTVFKVLQELVTNALKHADAKNLDIQINGNDDGTMLVSVEDDGKGFDVHLNHNEGIGLKNIRYRISYIGGELEINSSPGKGACFMIQIPVATSNKTSIAS